MKRVLLLLTMVVSMLSAMAEENVLQSIEIAPVKDTYNIVLVSDKAVDVKKVVQAPNKITLNMKDIRASKSLNTIYNNVENVDTVMVEPQGNGISIFFQAENASAATITFDSLAPAAPVVSNSKNLKLNNPIESYAPIYTEDFETAKTSKLFDKLKSSSAVVDIKDTLDEESASDFGQKVFSFGLLLLLGVGVIRLFKRKEPEMKIGLSQSLNEREINMFRGVQPVQQTYANAEKPFTTVNYGLNAYQKETRNPYESEPMTIHNPKLRNYTTPQIQNTVATQPVSRPQPQVATIPQVKKLTTPVNNAPVNQSNPNVDNLKFLESMTAIYEKSGRHDLARGLRASLNKNNIN
ncbi:MAG: hypothetical protein NC408_06855 [Candidatus Gastranaerophilales bacterium]|nr:hypothetical protein [Candidatus Gastranaerophilales bacterium]MCM1072473.1 hypothetical protein [Bacteroides sp.]